MPMINLMCMAMVLGATELEANAEVHNRPSVLEIAPHAIPKSGAKSSRSAVPEEGRWVEHEAAPMERVGQVAARYGVKKQSVMHWNRLSKTVSVLRPGQKLRVHARQIVPTRRPVEHVVQPGHTWDQIAVKYRVEHRDLKAYNSSIRDLVPGQRLIVWVDPAAPRTVNVERGPEMPESFEVRPNALSMGTPNQGSLKRAVPVPRSENYTVRNVRDSWGSSYAVLNLQMAMAKFRQDSGYRGKVIIGAMSRKNGGYFPPHQSHQSGRDVDVFLPLLPGVPETMTPNPDEIDWSAAWELVRAFVNTEAVEAIFLESELQARLHQAGRWEGASIEELARIIQWAAREHGFTDAIVRHSPGHDGHIHVRFKCGPGEKACQSLYASRT